MATSVAMKPSIVAMCGSIMPEPLLIPVIVISLVIQHDTLGNAFGNGVRCHDGFGRRDPIVLDKCLAASSTPLSSRFRGSGSMMTPVENGRTCIGEQSKISATFLQVS